MKEWAVLAVLASKFGVEHARDLGLILALASALSAAGTTASSSFGGSRECSTSGLIDFHVFKSAFVTLGTLATVGMQSRVSFAHDLGKCSDLWEDHQRLRGLSYGCSVSACSFSGHQLLHPLDKIIIRVLLIPFLGSIINLQIKLQLGRTPMLTEKNVPQCSFRRLMIKTSDDGFPIVDEGAEVKLPTPCN